MLELDLVDVERLCGADAFDPWYRPEPENLTKWFSLGSENYGYSGRETLKTILDQEFEHLVFDKTLARAFNHFQVGFTNKNQDHMTFFGGNLTGVEIVRWQPEERDTWFTDILKVDDYALEQRVHRLKDINPNHKVSSDIFNITAVYCIHRFQESMYLSHDEKLQAMLDVCLIMHYRFLSSLLFKYFRYPANKAAAAATYEKLSMKFGLKQKGNWYALLVDRSKDFMNPNGIWGKVLKTFQEDYDVVRMINDAQGRIRDIMKNIYKEFMLVVHSGERIALTTHMGLDIDGEEILRDSTQGLAKYRHYLESVIVDPNSFIRAELVDVICSILNKLPHEHLVTVLKFVAKNFRYSQITEIEDLVEDTLSHSFEYFAEHRNILNQGANLPELIGRLKGVYMASRSTNAQLLKMRQNAERIVSMAVSIRTDSVIANLRTALLLYICLRAYTMHYYTSK